MGIERAVSAVVVAVLVVSAPLVSGGADATSRTGLAPGRGGDDAPPGSGTPIIVAPDPDAVLADPTLEQVVRDVGAGRPVDSDDALVHDGLVRVEVSARPGRDARAAVLAEGGEVRGAVGQGFVLADVPASRVEDLQARPAIAYVRLPRAADLPVADPAQAQAPPGAGPGVLPAPSAVSAAGRGQYGGEAVVKTQAAAWQQAGFRGGGVKIGIIDVFDGATWNASVAAGELAGNPAGAFCLRYGASCGSTFWSGGQTGRHGVAVAEVISDMAPDATLYLASATSPTDMQAAVDYFAANGVRIISHSETGLFDGPGNGTGPVDSVIAHAEARGIAWFQAAGNSAGVPGSYVGSYFRSGWVDTDGDGFMNFPNGSEYLAFNCGYLNGLRWSDWSGNATDYDLYVYEDPGTTPIFYSQLNQQLGYPPLETFADGHGCTGSDVDYLAIDVAQAGNGTAGDVLEFMTNGSGVAYWSNPFTASAPYADTASPGAAAIGAVDPVNGTTIAPYSSQGPTNDGRTKPDLSAASNMTNLAEGGHFNGTSAATPVAAGAAAVLLSAYPGWVPAQLVGTLRGQVVDRGAVGADNVYGAGELTLGSPPAPAVTSPGKVRKLRVLGRPTAARRLTTWRGPQATGGAPVVRYVVAVYHGRKKLWQRTVSASHHRIRLSGRALRPGRNQVYVAAFNGTAYSAWKHRVFRAR